MKHLQIFTHAVGRTYEQPHFFILNKGANSGKPLISSCRNCFVFIAEDERQMELYYWIFYGLWRAKSFHAIHKGSVVIFVSLSDLKSIVFETAERALDNISGFEEAVKKLKKLDHLEQRFLTNLKPVNEAKQIVFYRYARRR